MSGPVKGRRTSTSWATQRRGTLCKRVGGAVLAALVLAAAAAAVPVANADITAQQSANKSPTAPDISYGPAFRKGSYDRPIYYGPAANTTLPSGRTPQAASNTSVTAAPAP